MFPQLPRIGLVIMSVAQERLRGGVRRSRGRKQRGRGIQYLPTNRLMTSSFRTHGQLDFIDREQGGIETTWLVGNI